jgi:plasmid stability protein
MIRTQILLDEPTYRALRRRAYEKGCSLSAVVRDILGEGLRRSKAKRKLTIKDFTFIGAGRSKQGKFSPVSERHDEALAEALFKELRR